MSLFSKLIKATIDTATAPLEPVKDVLTMGGVLTDKDEPYTVKRLKKLKKDADEVRDAVDDL